ncbi:MAG TPA: TIGR01620 family protein [Methylomirabilota bacterium]|nr:TIGR01620 family protein [Methylomirabilota bacterium]
MTGNGRKPSAFRIDDDTVAVVRDGARAPLGAAVLIEPEIEETPEPPLPRRRRGFPWGRLFWSALSGLVVFAIGLMVDQLIRDLFARNDWLGWTGLVLAILAGLAALAMILREVVGLVRIARIDSLRERGAAAAARDDDTAAQAVARDLVTLYRDRPDTARGRAALSAHVAEVIDGGDLLKLAEAELLHPLDAGARRLVSDTCRRVSLVTAVSPRAIVDVVFVLVAVVGLIRKLAELYGGRPGLIGLVSLTRHVVSHLAVTGGMAVGDSLIQQVVGHGVAARLSARLGEGVINGLLTARVGLAAIEVCRPLPFLAKPGPGISEVMGGVLTRGEAGDRDPS